MHYWIKIIICHEEIISPALTTQNDLNAIFLGVFSYLIFLLVQDVMGVGEPTLMGGEFGDEDERVITRLENNQYETNGPDDPNNPQGVDIKLGGQTPGGGGPQPPNQGGGATTPGGSSSQFHGSPQLHSPWGQDKKTPQPAEPPIIETKTE